MDGTKGPHQVQLRSAAHAGDLRPEGLRKLHGYVPTSPEAPMVNTRCPAPGGRVAQGLQGGEG